MRYLFIVGITGWNLFDLTFNGARLYFDLFDLEFNWIRLYFIQIQFASKFISLIILFAMTYMLIWVDVWHSCAIHNLYSLTSHCMTQCASTKSHFQSENRNYGKSIMRQMIASAAEIVCLDPSGVSPSAGIYLLLIGFDDFLLNL